MSTIYSYCYHYQHRGKLAKLVCDRSNTIFWLMRHLWDKASTKLLQYSYWLRRTCLAFFMKNQIVFLFSGQFLAFFIEVKRVLDIWIQLFTSLFKSIITRKGILKITTQVREQYQWLATNICHMSLTVRVQTFIVHPLSTYGSPCLSNCHAGQTYTHHFNQFSNSI